jgi:hypothetical protein
MREPELNYSTQSNEIIFTSEIRLPSASYGWRDSRVG